MKNQILSNLAKNYFKYKDQHKHASVSKEEKVRLDQAEGLWSKDVKAQLPDRNSSKVKKTLANFLGIKPENISVFAGADEVIEIIPRLYLNPKQNVIVVTPTFDRLLTTNLKVGAKVFSFNLAERTHLGLEKSDISKLSKKSRDISAKLIWLCSPNNPTGQVIELSTIERIAKDNPKSLVVVNEVYQEYFSLDKGCSSVSLIDKIPNLIVVRSFSKAFNLAGVRVGYVVSSPEIISHFENFRTMYNLSLYAQENAVEALSSRNLSDVAVILNNIEKERERLVRIVKGLDNFEVIEGSRTNFLFLKHKKKDLFSELYKKNIVVSDWRNAAGVEGKNYVRVSVGQKKQNDKLVSILKEID